MSVLADLKNRGVRDVFFVVCDGLKGLPDSGNAVFPQAIVQACVIHLIRATLRYASRKYWDQLAKNLRAIYTAPSVEAAWAEFEELEKKVGQVLPGHPEAVALGVGKSSHPSWPMTWRSGECCSPPTRLSRSTPGTGAAVTAKGHFPTEQAALKTLYLVTRGMDPKGTGQARWTMRWKPALNAFAVTFADRMPAAENL